jgi:hexosaminidase
MKRAHILTAALLAAAGCRGGRPPVTPSPTPMTVPRLVPAPTSLALAAGAPFVITATTAIAVEGDGAVARVGEALAAKLRTPTGYPIPLTPESGAPAGSIHLVLDDRPTLGEEGYELTVASDGVRLVAGRPAGLFRGVQTIRQLLPDRVESQIRIARVEWAIPALAITDAPRFAWRGAMLDVARHFMTVKEVQQFIDLLALYKMNVLHLHLSDDQGWRIEIRSRPTLASIGGATQVGGGPGGFYTQEEYAALVQYAAARFITIVPEIDMPGHSNAALVAFPELACSTRRPQLYTGIEVGWSTFCVDKEETYALIDDVVRELAALTPGPFIHLGGDEVQALSRAQYTSFVERVQDIVGKHGKRMVGWEEVAHARLRSTTVVQHWRSDSAAVALQYGARLVLSPAKKVYLDMKYTPVTELGLNWAGYVDVRDTYDWNPAAYLPGVTEGDVLGVEAPIWSETLPNITAVEYMALPRLPAAAEVGWTIQGARDWESFRERLATHAPRWRRMGVNYYPSTQIPW